MCFGFPGGTLLNAVQMLEELLQLPHMHGSACSHCSGDWKSTAVGTGVRLLHVDNSRYWHYIRQAYQYPSATVQNDRVDTPTETGVEELWRLEISIIRFFFC